MTTTAEYAAAIKVSLDAGPTPGPRVVMSDADANMDIAIVSHYAVCPLDDLPTVTCLADPKVDAEFIAACSPEALRALLQERERMLARAPFDTEAMLRACVPGGSVCDPQQIADSIRAWAAHRGLASDAQEGR